MVCHYCGGTLIDWMPYDLPITEYYYYFSKCAYAFSKWDEVSLMSADHRLTTHQENQKRLIVAPTEERLMKNLKAEGSDSDLIAETL